MNFDANTKGRLISMSLPFFYTHNSYRFRALIRRFCRMMEIKSQLPSSDDLGNWSGYDYALTWEGIEF